MRSPPHPPPPALPAAEGSLRKGWRLGPARATVEPKLVRGPPTNFRGGPGQRPGGEGAPRATQDTFRKLGSKLRAPCPLLLPATSGGRSAGVRGEEWGGGRVRGTSRAGRVLRFARNTRGPTLTTVGRAPGLTLTVSQRQLRVKGGPETPLPKESGICVPQ